MDYLLTNGEDTQAMNTAILCVVEARDPDLNSHLINYLLGETDGIVKVYFKFTCFIFYFLSCYFLFPSFPFKVIENQILQLSVLFSKGKILVNLSFIPEF